MGNNFVNLTVSNKYNKTDNNSELRNTKVFLIYNPKTIICEAQAIKAEKYFREQEIKQKAVQAKKSVR